MSTQNIRYSYDRTGRSRDNLVINEEHQLRDVEMRVFAPNAGAFYTESVVVRDVANGQILRLGTQYKFGNYYPEASREANKEVATIIVITDANVSNRVAVDYQVVGGLYGFSNQAIILQIEALRLDRRPAKWKNIFDKPDGYTPSPHTHTMMETFGYQHLITQLNQIRHAILTGDEASHTAIYEYIDGLEARLQGLGSSTGNTLSGHTSNRNNPHGVTAAQINAYTKQEITGLLNEVKRLMNDHINQRGNVHGLTPTVLGVYDKNEINSKFQDIINKLKPLEAHILRLDNPHGVTAEQVNTFTKQVIDQKISAVQGDLNRLKTSRNSILKMTAGDVGAYTKVETNNEIDRRVNGFKDAITTNNKLKDIAFPVSTNGTNELYWDRDGWYCGPRGQAWEVYVDAVLGRDIAPNGTNGAGTKNNPYRSVKFAIDQAKPNEYLRVYLKEEQEHIITAHDGNGRIDIKGRRISFRNYGPRFDSINKHIYNNTIHTFSASLIFDTWEYKDSHFYGYIFTNDGSLYRNSYVAFEGLRLERRIMNPTTPAGPWKMSSNSGIFNGWTDFDVVYYNCRIDTGSGYKTSKVPFHSASSGNRHRIRMYNMNYNHITGDGYLFQFHDGEHHEIYFYNYSTSSPTETWSVANFDSSSVYKLKRDMSGQYVSVKTNIRSTTAGFHVGDRPPTSDDVRNMGLEDGFVWFHV